MTAPAFSLLYDYIAWWADQTPNAEACVFEGRRWSYVELRSAVDEMASALVAAGVCHGDRVATLQTSRPEYLVSFLAATSIGAIWVGLNPKYRYAEFERVTLDCSPKILITRTRIGSRDYTGELAQLVAEVPSLEQLIVFEGDPLIPGAQMLEAFVKRNVAEMADLAAARARCNGNDPCLIVYTSGSTGTPKGALLHHEGLIGYATAQNKAWPVSPLRILTYFPINHIGCVADLCIPCLVAGGAIVFMEQFDAAESMRLIATEGVTFWMNVPSVFQLQFSVPGFDDLDLSALQLIAWEGAAVPENILARLMEFKVPLATNYSMTEALGVTVHEPSRDTESLSATCGGAFPECDIRLIMENGEDAPCGEAGEVWVRSSFIMRGYWQREDATRDAITDDGFFKTGDLAVRRPDGRYRLVGRLKEMYKSGGYNVYPREVETVIEAHPFVDIAAVVSVDDPLWQEVGIAYVTCKNAVPVVELDEWCRERLANYKVPKQFVIQSEMPLLPTGKVDKKYLQNEARATQKRFT